MSMLSESGYSRRGFYGVVEADGDGSARVVGRLAGEFQEAWE
ncbi:hypothetical protein E2C01_067729 [Portunus trituberculatus]|uniref:Uncharacterized protein n=1 Tax=Portunus trituberculatus TaxID=210409 RepID=A0A5B7HKK9_PORTR|nr:hypothetical protein [Portunus trituberculatus]